MDETVGKILRARREALKWTIEDVSKKTSLRVDCLEKLENDDFSIFKTPVYVKGTIRCYANYLGLNGLDLVKMFKKNQQDMATFAAADIGQKTIDAIRKSKVNVNLIQQPGIGTQTSFSKDGNQIPFKQIFFGLILVGIIAVGCYFAPGMKYDNANFNFIDSFTGKISEIYGTFNNLVSENRSEKEEKKRNTVTETKDNAGFNQKLKDNITTKNQNKAIVYSKPNVSAKKVDKNAIAARYDKVVVEMTASGQCWIDVFSDGKAIFSGMLSKGSYKIFEANKRVTVRYGNIGVVQVIVNGKQLNMRGEAGVATRHYPK